LKALSSLIYDLPVKLPPLKGGVISLPAFVHRYSKANLSVWFDLRNISKCWTSRRKVV